MSRTVEPPHRSGPRILLFAGVPIAMLVIGLALAAGGPRPTNPPAAQAPVPHFVDVRQPGGLRTVVVGGATDRLPGTSNEAGYLMANLRTGQIPAGATEAVVLNDRNCEPDADGISHCLNDLQIGDVIATVQHHHAMTAVPCLTPGETVALMPLAAYRD